MKLLGVAVAPLAKAAVTGYWERRRPEIVRSLSRYG
jgi:hypothetical protein